MKNYSDETPIWQLSVGELRTIIKNVVAENRQQNVVIDEEVCYGIKGIAKELGVSERTAQRYKSEGMLDKAITQVGRTIIFEKAKLK